MLHVIIMAAGKGTRMHSQLPKVLQPLAGKPLLAHVLQTARALKPQAITVIYGYGAQVVRAAFSDAANVDLNWALQDPPQGTGHAVQMATPFIADEGVCLVLNGDVPLIEAATIGALTNTCGANTLSLLTANAPDPSGLGRIVRNAAGEVERIMEEKDARAQNRDDVLAVKEIYTGVLAAPSAWLKAAVKRLTNNNAQKEYYLTDLIAMAKADGLRIATAQPASQLEWQGINDKVQLAQLERDYQRAQAHALMLRGTTLSDPARIDIRGQLSCDADVEIDVGCVFQGRVHLGAGVKVGAYCVISEATIGAGSTVAAYTHIEGATCGANVRLGPYARLRPGTTLADEVHIGNFTEVKNSQINQGSKANHLAYIGDATIGKNVNVGAGTITCNYDGANKYRTVIEDNVFIGSDTQLVAPVTVRAGATLGAGTTLTKEAPADALTVSRVKQVTITGWRRPVKTPKPIEKKG